MPAAVGAQTVLFAETFDSDLGTSGVFNDAVASNAWQFRDDCAANPLAGHSAPGVARWGNPGSCTDYGTDPASSTDFLLTPVVDISSCPAPNRLLLTFNYFLELEEPALYDWAVAGVEVDGSGFLTVIADNDDAGFVTGIGGLLNNAGWKPFSLDLSALLGGGTNLRVGFIGSTVDDIFNAGQGFLVDDVEVVCLAAAVDLAITKTDDVDPVTPGGTLNYQIAVTNQAVVDYSIENSRDDGVPAFNFQDISATGTPISLGDDEVSAAIPLGFPFEYFGNSVSEVFVSSNGFLTVLPGQSHGCCDGQPIPTPGNPDGVIAGWWADLNPQGGGEIHSETLGTAPDRVLIVQFEGVPHFLGPPVTFQFKLFEGSNEIEIHYLDAPSDGFSFHTVGVEDPTGTRGQQFFHELLVPMGEEFQDFAVRFTPDAGGTTAQNVVVGDVMPPGLSLVGATPSQGSCYVSTLLGLIACSLGDLNPAASATVDVEATVAPGLKTAVLNTAEVSSDQEEMNSADNTATELTSVAGDVDLAVSVTESADPVPAGGVLTHVVTVTNQSAAKEANQVTVLDELTLPPGVSLLVASATTGTGSVDLLGPTVEWTIERLPAGGHEMLELDLEVTVETADGAAISDQAAITGAAQNLINPGDDVAGITTTVTRPVDLTILKVGPAGPLVAGSTLTYNLTVSNQSLSQSDLVGRSATAVTATDALPPELSFISATASQGSCGEAGGVVTCQLGDLALGASALIDIDVKVSPSAGGSISNSASVTSGEAELDGSDNTATATTTIVNSTADFMLAMVGSPSAVVPGGEIAYTLTVTNLGPVNAAGGQIVAPLPTMLSFVSSPDGCTLAGSAVTCTLGPIAASAAATRTFVLAVDALAALGPLSNVATVIGSTTDPNLDNNTATAVNSVVDPASLTIFLDGFESGDTSAWSQASSTSSRAVALQPEPPALFESVLERWSPYECPSHGLDAQNERVSDLPANSKVFPNMIRASNNLFVRAQCVKVGSGCARNSDCCSAGTTCCGAAGNTCQTMEFCASRQCGKVDDLCARDDQCCSKSCKNFKCASAPAP